MSGLRSVSDSDLKVIFSKYSAPPPSGQSGNQMIFSSIEDSIEALIMLNHRSVAIGNVLSLRVKNHSGKIQENILKMYLKCPIGKSY